MRNFWLIVSVFWLYTCGGGGGGSSPTEPQEPAPIANFTVTPTTTTQGQVVTFTSTSTGTITSYAWNVDADPAIEGTIATYTHTYTDIGVYSVTLTVTGPGGSNPKTIADMITINSAAPIPTTTTTQTTQEDGSTTISLTATDPNGQAVTFAITTNPTNGTATLSGTDVTYTPNANFYGTDSFDYTASNGTYTSDPVTITITVEGEDDGNPTANDVSATTDEDTAVNVTLDATEIDGDNYSFNIVSQPTHGTLGSINGNQVEYTPNQDWNGTDTFTFEATDDRTFRRNVATATITVNPVNDAPVTNDINTSTLFNTAVDIDLSASDVDGDNLTYSSITDASNGSTSLSGSVATYTPNNNWTGTDTFTYKVNDGTSDSNTSTVTITVNEGIFFTFPTGGETLNAGETYQITWSTTYSLVENLDLRNDTFTGGAPYGNKCLYGCGGPAPGTTGAFSWSIPSDVPTNSNYYLSIGGEASANLPGDDSGLFTIENSNTAPVANDVTASTQSRTNNMRQAVTITLDATDVDGDDLTYSLVSDVSNGTTSLSGNVVTYTPTANYDGTDTFTYKANDGTFDSNTATGTITITDVNNTPIAANFEVNTDEELPINFTFNLTDPDGDENLTITITENPLNGSLTQNTLTEYRYTPNTNFSGTDSLKYTVSDESLTSSEATVTLKVSNPFYEIPFNSSTESLSVLNKGSYIIIANSQGGAKKYDSDMNEIWTIDDFKTGNNLENPVKIKEYSDGSIYLLATDKIAKYSSSGSFEWKADLSMDLARDFIFVDDGIIIGGHQSIIDSWNSYLATEKLSYADGSSIWTKEHSAYTSSNWRSYYSNASIFQSSSGDIFFASAYFLMKFTSSQPIPSWVKTLSFGRVHQATISSNDEIILIAEDGGQNSNFQLYDLSGNLISSQQISALHGSSPSGIYRYTLSSTISNDGVFYAVTYDGDWGGLDLIKYDGSDLTQFRRIELYDVEQIGWSGLGERYYPASIDIDSGTVIHIFNFRVNPFNSQSFNLPLMIKTDLNGNILIP